MTPEGVVQVLGLFVLHGVCQYALWCWEHRHSLTQEEEQASREWHESQVARREQDVAFEEERQARRERGLHHRNDRVDQVIRAAARETNSRPPRGEFPDLAILDAHPGARVVQTTHDEVTVEVQQPDWGPIEMNVELKGEWDKADLPPQTQWERLMSED